MSVTNLLKYPSTRITRFYINLERSNVKCIVCERGCIIPEGGRGFCQNRINIEGKLYTIGYGLLSAIESRPIEIKPLYHYWPGSTALTFSNWGCNFKCPWCQNFTLSFQNPDPERDTYYPPDRIVDLAVKAGDEGVCASFNEPTVQVEYLLDVFKKAKTQGLYSCIVSNGYMSINVLEELVEAGMSGMNIDIKGCPETYKKFIGGLDPNIVFRNAKKALDLGVHVEMVFLIVTGANDWWECIAWVIRKHLDILGGDIPLHINRYYPANKYFEPPTDVKKLVKAYEYAKSEGIKYVYIGNVNDPTYETTYCPRCGKTLIYRRGYSVVTYNIQDDLRCPKCGEKIFLTGKYISKLSRWKTFL